MKKESAKFVHFNFVLCFAIVALTPILKAQSVIQFSASNYSVTEGVPNVAIVVEREGDLGSEVGVEFTTATNANATSNIDYRSITTNLTFLAGESSKLVFVPILNEGVVEGLETLQVILSNPSVGAVLGTRTNATVQITDNDKGLQLELNSYFVNEDNGLFRVRVLRGDDGDFPVSVSYATSNITAVAGVDYVATVGILNFAPGERLKTIAVPLLNDAVLETNKAFRITLYDSSSGSVFAPPVSATVTITNADEVIQFEAVNCTNLEGAAIARVVVIRGESASVGTVDICTANGTATAGEDYAGFTNTLSFLAGESLKFVDIRLLNDGVQESSENLRVLLSNPTGNAVLGDPFTRAATLSIVDNDPGVGFESSTNTVWERTAEIDIRALRGNDGSLEPFTVNYQTVEGTALAGVDYETVSGTLSFEASEFVKSIRITLLANEAAEASKFFIVLLTNISTSLPLGRAFTRVEIMDSSQGKVQFIQPSITSEIRKAGDLIDVGWEGSGIVSRANSPTGIWERLGPADNQFVISPDLPGAFYRVESPRPARLYVPSGYDGQMPMPLVLVLHGYGVDAAGYVNYFRMEPLAESRGFLICHPDGTINPVGSRFWNATEVCCNFYGSTVDDSGYLSGLIEEIARQYKVDRKRIYLVGHSNGGFMSYRMACDHANLIAGIASLAGATFLDSSTPRPSEPVSVLQIHGTLDNVVPYEGGALNGIPAQALFPGAVATIEIWAAFNGCQEPEWDARPSMDLDLAVAGLDTLVTHYTSSPPGGAVELWTILGGRHIPRLMTASQTSDFSARVVDWLLAHPKP